MHRKRRGSEKSTFLAIFWGFLIFSGAPVLWEFHKKTFKFNKITDFYNTACKSTCLYNAPSSHTVKSDFILKVENNSKSRTARSPHHPHKIDDQHCECKTGASGGGAYFVFFLASDNSHTTPPPQKKIPPDEEGLVWGWCVVG